MTWIKGKRIAPLIVLAVVIVLLALIPTVQTLVRAGAEWHSVPPEYVSDSLFYYAQVRQVAEGHPFIGNPYFIEHRNTVSPAFFVPDWLYAMPLLLGVSLSSTIILNFVLWSLVFAFLAFGIFRAASLPRSVAVGGSVFLYLESYWLILRPVSMQQVFPFLLFFFFALILWLREPARRRNTVMFTLATVAPFYIYAYLWQVVVVINGLLAAYLLLRRKNAELYQFVIANVAALVLALPEIVLLSRQFLTPFYWDTMQRIGLVETHIPPLYALYYVRWIGLIVLIGLLLYLFLRKRNEQAARRVGELNLFSFLTGLGLFIVMVSNIITGKELETATHIGRFVMVWLAFCFVAYGFFVVKERTAIKELSVIKKSILVLAFLLCALGLMRNFSESLPFKAIAVNTSLDSVQGYAAPLAWLDKKEKAPVVIWADGLLSHYVPIMTKHYVLFAAAGGLQVESSQEVEERYLVSSYFDNLSVADLERNYRIYAGAGNAADRPEAFSRMAKVCNFFQLYRLGYACGDEVTGVDLRGQTYFSNLDVEYKAIQSNIDTELKKFGVAYFIKDKDNDPQFHPENIKGSTLVYDDGRFSIYKIK
ncbi:MAG: hypothetical protein ACYC1Y_03720 [Minisyncoccota bacterium]